jgi:diguanylate cyclase (GGDEF)-like protein
VARLTTARQTAARRTTRALLAALWLAWGACAGPAIAEDTAATAAAVASDGGLEEIVRLTPERAERLVDALGAQTRSGTVAERGRYLVLACELRDRLGRHAEALALCNQALQLGRDGRDTAVEVRALLAKSRALSGLNDRAQAHALAREAERRAAGIPDVALRVRTLAAAGESYSEEGNFSSALQHIQSAVTLARQHGMPLPTILALRSLADLHNRMRDNDKAYAVLEEAMRLAREIDSPGRLAILYTVEYGIAVDSGDVQRGLKALLSALEMERRIGARALMANTLVNLSDCYLRLHDYRNALSYGRQGLDAAQRLNDDGLGATALINIGQAYLALGRVAEGKKSVEQAMEWYEHSADKPDLQIVLLEYGSALEKAGDLPGALAAYHRERALSDELFERRRQTAVLELQAKYEDDLRQRQITQLRRDNQLKSTELDNRRLQQRVWWLLALVFALATAVVGLLYRKVRQAYAQLEQKNHELEQQSARDPLTALYNRRHFQESMRDHAAGGPGMDAAVGAIFLLDVDHFKQINDTHGHGAGDAVLREIAAALRDILRETDMIVRWGGEEFLAFLPKVPHHRLDEVAQRLLAGIPQRAVVVQGKALSAHVSIGYAPFPLAPHVGLSWERVVNIVDMALYLAKKHGRNRAYGVGGLVRVGPDELEEIELDLERAWRTGAVELSVVTGPARAAPDAVHS